MRYLKDRRQSGKEQGEYGSSLALVGRNMQDDVKLEVTLIYHGPCLIEE